MYRKRGDRNSGDCIVIIFQAEPAFPLVPPTNNGPAIQTPEFKASTRNAKPPAA